MAVAQENGDMSLYEAEDDGLYQDVELLQVINVTFFLATFSKRERERQREKLLI